MKRIFKRSFTAVICIVMAAALMGVCTFATSSTGQGGPGMGQGGPGMGQGGPGGTMQQGGKGQGGSGGSEFAISEIKSAIAALDDEDTQDDLTDLLEAYEDALEAEKTALASSSTSEATLKSLKEATTKARSALASALAKAGITLSGKNTQSGGQPGNGSSSQPAQQMQNGFGTPILDVDAIEDLIDDVNSSSAKKSLTKLLTTYKAALANEKAAMDDSDTTESEIKTLRDATQEAYDDLVEALEDAGIEKSEYMSAQSSPAPTNNGQQNTQTPLPQNTSAGGTANSSGNSASSGFLSGFFNWLSGLIK